MEVFSPEFMSALLAIVVIDLVLAGDNAIVIGLAAAGLPEAHRGADGCHGCSAGEGEVEVHGGDGRRTARRDPTCCIP